MDANKDRVFKKQRRHRRVRKKVAGDNERPRLCVFRSRKHIYAQIIDDVQGRTLTAVSSQKLGPFKAEGKAGKKTVAAREVGKRIAESATRHGIQKVAFDRGGYLYHGRVAALAEAAREGGLDF